MIGSRLAGPVVAARRRRCGTTAVAAAAVVAATLASAQPVAAGPAGRVAGAAGRVAPAGGPSSAQSSKPSSVASVSDDGRIAVVVREEGYPQNWPPRNAGYVRDTARQTTTELPRSSTAPAPHAAQVPVAGFDERVAVTPDGRHVAFSAWLAWPQYDIGVYDRWTGVVGTASTGLSGSNFRLPSLSDDGTSVAFAGGHGTVYVRDLSRGTVVEASAGVGGARADGGSTAPHLSGDGRFVAFVSAATNLVAGDTNGVPDVFVRDRRTGTVHRVSVSSAGDQGDGASGDVTLSADGRHVAFTSAASTLVTGDTNGEPDVFVRDRRAGVTRRGSVAGTGTELDGGAAGPFLSANGRFLAFSSVATNAVPADTNGLRDGFVRDLTTGSVRRVTVY